MNDEQILAYAAEILERRLRDGEAMNSPKAVQEYLKYKLGTKEHEVFSILYLDAQHRLIAYEELFRGTLNQTSVYPREVLKRALHYNCGAVIYAHCHPSGVAEPSRADELLTQALKSTLALVDIKSLDHIIVAGNQALSMAERGLL